MRENIWVTIRRVFNDCVAVAESFDTDDASLGMSIGFIEGYARANGLTKVDTGMHGIERYDLVDSDEHAHYVATVTRR